MDRIWKYQNPVSINFGQGSFEKTHQFINGRKYALITYSDDQFTSYTRSLIKAAGKPSLLINDIEPNPDLELLSKQAKLYSELKTKPEVIVALGGGSVIDSAKVFALAENGFGKIRNFVETKNGGQNLASTPIIAIPTTAGTGSEMTCWATIWDKKNSRKYSLAHEKLFPEFALIDPKLMIGKPYKLTLVTALDALSHALESIWNKNANIISANHATYAAKSILKVLPILLTDLTNANLRTEMASASVSAGLAFSSTKTAIAHNLSYPITLGWGVPHGIACSFTLPTILKSIVGIGGFREASLKEIFGDNLVKAADNLKIYLETLNIETTFLELGIPREKSKQIIDEAFLGERGLNFIGSKENFLKAAKSQGILH
jgi:alcohol dehydrogenase